MKLVTVKTFDSGISAHILKTKLESEGINSFVHDNNIVDTNPLLGVAVGGVKLRVDEKDVERAKEIIKSVEETPYTDENDNVIVCPSCGSSELYSGFNSIRSLASFLMAFVSIFMMIFPFYSRRVYRCKKCDAEFKMSKRRN